MKRIKSACICQTLHFLLKEDIAHDHAVQLVNDEVAGYKKQLERNRTSSACIFSAIYHKKPREYTKYSLRFLFHLTKNLTSHLTYRLYAVLP